MLFNRTAAAALVALITAAAIVASAAAMPPTRTVAGTHVVVYNPAGKPHARVLLYPGLSSTELMYETSPYDTVRAGLVEQGYQVIVVATPFDDPSGVVSSPFQVTQLMPMFETDPTGLTYRRAFVRQLDAVTSWARRKYGRLPTLSAGISWGGLHAIEAVCQRPKVFAGFIAMVPAVDPSQILAFRPFALQGLQGNACAPVLRKRTGYLAYGLADDVVGVIPSQRLAVALYGSRVVVQPFPFGHNMPPESVAAMLAWSAVQLPGA